MVEPEVVAAMLRLKELGWGSKRILRWLHAQSGMRRNRKLMLVRLRIEEKRKTLIPADDAAAVRKRRPQSY